MNRIGTTSQGGILMEMTPDDINRFQQAMAALTDLLVQGANHGIEFEPYQTCEATGTRQKNGSIKVTTIKPVVKIGDAVIVAPPLARKQARKYVRKAKEAKPVRAESDKIGATKSARAGNEAPTRLYNEVYEILKAGPLTSVEIVEQCAKKGIDTNKAKISVVLSTYKKLFKSAGNRKWLAYGFNGAPKPDPKATLRIVINDEVKAKRLELIRKLANKNSSKEPVIKETGLPSGDLDGVSEFQHAQREARFE